ncbi:unnamed protein product [Lymnaea stagnalis]|uniref:Sodium channel modifier 1 n=1 Tax=Lymnaea stagnalis TaxID=6523 RepID=A0AAV2HMT8_LYMST
MSFKREGNDTNLLSTLRKRRIKELLSEDIPEDEAKLLCNGRFACTVCQHNPIFDTVNMLSIHRNGKKHLFCYEIFMNKKKELKNLIAIRKQELFLKDGSTAINTVSAKEDFKGILTSSPYDSRVKKSKVRNSEATNSSKDVTKSKTDISGCSSHWANMCKNQISGPVMHDYKLKSIFERQTETPVRIVPYQSKHMLNLKTSCMQSKDAHHVQIKFTTASKPAYEQNDIPSQTINSNVRLDSSQTSAATGQTSSKHTDSVKSKSHPTSTSSKHSMYANKTFKSQSQKNIKSQKLKQDLCKKFSPKITEQASVTHKLRQLQGSGWKRDWDGKWIKDETAEFDSDEEPPDIPFQIALL